VKTIIFKISNEGAHYSATGIIPWSATNLPFGDFQFSERTDVFWQVELLAYNKNTARLQVQVLDFEAGEEGFNPSRRMRSPVRIAQSCKTYLASCGRAQKRSGTFW